MSDIIRDESGDQKYFVVTPHLVHAMCRTPYDFALWFTVKMIAGDHGECVLSLEDLATLAMMSVNKARDSRTFLIECGLLRGELKRLSPQKEIWVLTAPNIWPQNMRWRETMNSLKDRINLKAGQHDLLAASGQLRKFDPETWCPMPMTLDELPPGPPQNGGLHRMEGSTEWRAPQKGGQGSTEGRQRITIEEEPDSSLYSNQPYVKPGGDYLEDLVTFQPGQEQVGQPTGFQQHFGYRDEALQIYNDATARTLLPAQKAAVVEYANSPDFDMVRWRVAVESCIQSDVKPGNVLCMIAVAKSGLTYSEFMKSERRGGTHGRSQQSDSDPAGAAAGEPGAPPAGAAGAADAADLNFTEELVRQWFPSWDDAAIQRALADLRG